MAVLDVIRCDLPTYLVWKWRPADPTRFRDTTLRMGSSLRVKDGETAVFVYSASDGPAQEFIRGPCDQILKTANLPFLAGIVGLAFGGDSPFQAEVYFINTAGNITVRWGVPLFDCFDDRFPDLGVPVAARGSMVFSVGDTGAFVRLNRLIDFDLATFQDQLKAGIVARVKATLIEATQRHHMPLVQLERHIEDLASLCLDKVKAFGLDYGIDVKRFDIEGITVDKTSEAYEELKSVTLDVQRRMVLANTDVMEANLREQQRMMSENAAETLRIQREELQRAQSLQTQSLNLAAHTANLQVQVGVRAADSLGNVMAMGSMGGGGFNPAGMVAGMAVGQVVGSQMAGIVGHGMTLGMPVLSATGAPAPTSSLGAATAMGPEIFVVRPDGTQGGPFANWAVVATVLHSEHGAGWERAMVWMSGWPAWQPARDVPDVSARIGVAAPPRPPPPPPPPPAPPPRATATVAPPIVEEVFHAQFADGVFEFVGASALWAELAARGLRPEDVMVWKAGMTCWAPASSVLRG